MASTKLQKLVTTQKVTDLWLNLTREVIKESFDSGPFRRGEEYQKMGRVSKLSVEDDILTAEVRGNTSYTAVVIIDYDEVMDELYLSSECSCPVVIDCKHAVAVALAFLNDEVLVNSGNNQFATKSKPKESTARQKEKPRASADSHKKAHASDKAILDHLCRKPAGELANYALSLLKKLPTEYQNLRENLILESDDADQILLLAIEEVNALRKRMTTKSPYGPDRISHDFSKLNHYFQQLVRQSRAENILTITQDLFQIVFQYSFKIHKNDPLLQSFACCIPFIRQALDQSNRTELEKLQFWLVPIMMDEYGDLINTDEIFDPKLGKIRFWSSAADALLRMLKDDKAFADPCFSSTKFARGVDMVITCLKRANRQNEIIDLYRLEARTKYNNYRLINHLTDLGEFQEARAEILSRYKINGNLSDYDRRECLKRLEELALKQNDWTTIAGLRTIAFFTDPPTPTLYVSLMQSAAKIGKKDEIWAAVKHYLISRTVPFEKADGRTRQAKMKQVRNISHWPVAIPDEFWPIIPATMKYTVYATSILDLALAAGHLEDVIRIYEEFRAKEIKADWQPILASYLRKVTTALSEKCPQKSVEYFMEAVRFGLNESNRKSYEYVAQCLLAMYPLFATMRMETDWHALVRSIRESYPKKRILLEFLDDMEKNLSV